MTATNPTIAATRAHLNIPEIPDFVPDGEIVNEDGSVNTVKAAVYYTWNLPSLAQRLELSEEDLRKCLFKYTNNPDLKNPKIRTYLPQVLHPLFFRVSPYPFFFFARPHVVDTSLTRR